MASLVGFHESSCQSDPTDGADFVAGGFDGSLVDFGQRRHLVEAPRVDVVGQEHRTGGVLSVALPGRDAGGGSGDMLSFK